ncbi:hypothetical protein A2673_02330 [Candidatus Kaiserbacteria bacterium RIFCSPHIGHO2_01_FULL_50_13]|uniref:Response regulatory domain-containing protein n=1 Tax=Candidatus Kaiserbacteria bacterium RIFCSPLOWO2_01_FULL_50_24 TaxID=1798507 RepID=A0A1F6EQY5_9BACT|nr:MAG: hypothetical protein A2673_02330 [Candidatus Kaiserbacteria bacterium RIFCSPHIGHO2_01_FULL_50_13]OGG76037.1 MAG: hypothetical protein A3A34_00085 [Candidatus Kaiserbacteria bacterium RIFCSPLOWO2_01_FULL_50_24]OGG82043.1 MAG: hypothetical protein A3H74_03500 [Candidatus Kaiserbacteria bacterium RIFCSPLOWO2_02_FULL_51_13]
MNDMKTKKGTVLIVDDDKFLADMYSVKFSREGYAVGAYLSVADALAALKKGFVPDVVLFDLVMPEHDGFSFLTELRDGGLAKGAVLIALTNQSDDMERIKAEELGCDRYVIKATTIPSEVVAIVGEEMAKKRK